MAFKIPNNIYNAVRNTLVAIVVAISVLYLALYISVSIPAVQDWIGKTASAELEKLLGGKVEIGKVEISPFNRLNINHVIFISPQGEKVAVIERLGAGISISDLLLKHQITITYAEIIGLDATISQSSKNGPYNIQYIIDALSPKDKSKPPTKFDLAIHSIVLRQCAISYEKKWIPRSADEHKFNPNHIRMKGLRADIDLPRIANDNFNVDIKRMSFKLVCGLDVKMLKLKAHITDRQLHTSDFSIILPGTSLKIPDIDLAYSGYADIVHALLREPRKIKLKDWSVTPADFRCFNPSLARFNSPLMLDAEAELSQNSVAVNQLILKYPKFHTSLVVPAAIISNWNNPERLHFRTEDLRLRMSGSGVEYICHTFPAIEKASKHLLPLGNIDLRLTADGSPKDFKADIIINTSAGNIKAVGNYRNTRLSHDIRAEIKADNMELGRISGVSDLGSCIFHATGDISLNGKDVSGEINMSAPLLTWRGHAYNNISVSASHSTKETACTFSIADEAVALTLDADISGLGDFISNNRKLSAEMDLNVAHFNPIGLNLPGAASRLPQMSFAGHIDGSGSSLKDLNVDMSLRNVLIQPHGKHAYSLTSVDMVIENTPENNDRMWLDCDFLKFEAEGSVDLAQLSPTLKDIFISSTRVMATKRYEADEHTGNDFSYRLDIKDSERLCSMFNLPVKILDKASLSGSVNADAGTASLLLDAPWIQQGKNKLIRETRLRANMDAVAEIADLNVSSIFPAKKSDVMLNISAKSSDQGINTQIGWEFFKETAYKGDIAVNTVLAREPINRKLLIDAEVLPSKFLVNDTVWNVNPATINVTDKDVFVNGLKIWRENQFVLIDGQVSSDPENQLRLSLGNIDLSYIFEVLDINYVNFGGIASGDFIVSDVTGGIDDMVAYTPGLKVKGLAYNRGVLGDAVIQSRWHGSEKMVSIDADVKDGPDYWARINGGIWVTRDSLSFDFDTKGVNVKFLQPFMSAFSSDVSGRATGHAKLYGTFSDIDLVGKIYVHPLKLKVDYTNVYYTCSDTVTITPGLINIENVTIQDKNGHTARLNGFVKHRYFHEPQFEFKVSDAQDLLCYDTNASVNPIWYGTIYGNGGGTIIGKPGLVDIAIDMQTAARSKFTFVIDKTESADEYQFLRFTDRRKEAELARRAREENTEPEFVKQFRRKTEENQGTPSTFKMDLRATVTPEAQLIIVMDPVGGDRIRANGSGSLQIGYNSDDDNMTMYGRYTLDNGSYNFTLQDLIIKDFSIRPGSTIQFNGDPYAAILDIAAAYRVNANLTELDKSFATDRDLTRTNVPVDAMLLVKGEMQKPSITFDIEMPTVTQDVVRKVKSLVSTEDMMSRQIIYLLALHRFYTPEYTGTQRNNNELASVASSTISAQIGNAFGHLTDNFTFTPFFRTEKGDFSDMEVDLALSSSLFNNRLLINGNLGYRDHSTSSTTFIGDFDIEYLLNRQGSLRLKAYNHYNDANYYLRSALTTQGVGIIYKLEFNDLRDLFRRKPKKVSQPDTLKSTIK